MRYILHGGNTTRDNSLNKEFFSLIGDNLDEGDKVLLCYFAPSENSNRSEEEKYKVGIELFKKNISKKIEYILATRENFIKEIRGTDVLYIHGGDTDKLFLILNNYPEFIDEIKKKKLVIGSSAGAYILAKYSIDYVEGSIAKERYGILPIKIFCHFKEEDRSILEDKFKKIDTSDRYKTVFLKDCESRVIDI